jgi:hypothetical protein
VHARAVGLVVEAADLRGQSADERSQHQHEHRGDREADQRRPVLGQCPQ